MSPWIAVVPIVLIALMFTEWWLARRMGRQTHGFRQTLNNLGVAVVREGLHAAFAVAPFAGYAWLSGMGLFTWSPSDPLHWVLAVLLIDLSMYLRHLAAHRVGLLWAIHAVHHQSTEYNLTVGTRAGLLQDTFLVLVPAALLGVPLAIAFPIWASLSAFTWLSHTELVGRIPILDRWLVTPSNHRVHHARNPQYLDRNYGAFLLVWDRLFDTWTPETEAPEYGTLAGLPSYDPLVNNLTPFAALRAKMCSAPTRLRALACLVMPPEWDPNGTVTEPKLVDDPMPQRRINPNGNRRLAGAALLACGVLAMGLASTSDDSVIRLLAGVAAIASVGVAGALQDGRYAFLGGVDPARILPR